MAAVDAAATAALNKLAQATQPTNAWFLEFMLSPLFIILIIYVLIFTPFGILGMGSLITRINNWNKQRSGFMKMRKKLSNLHWIDFWIKPTGRKTTIKTEEGIEMELPIEISEGMLGLEKEITKVKFNSEKKVKEEKKKNQTVIDIHVEPKKKGKLSNVEMQELGNLLGRLNQ